MAVQGPIGPTAIDVTMDRRTELQRLAATRAALDPERRRTRADVLLSAIVEFLAASGGRSVAALTSGINEIWRTHSVTNKEVETALRYGESVGLVNQSGATASPIVWTATDGATEESRLDRDWAHRVLSELDESVTDKADALGYELSDDERREVVRNLLRALADGCKVQEEAPAAGAGLPATS